MLLAFVFVIIALRLYQERGPSEHWKLYATFPARGAMVMT